MNHDLTIGHEDQMAIVLGQRQLMAVCCMFLVVLGLVSTLSYVAGRSITAAQYRGMERAEYTAPAPAPVMVDPVRRATPAAAPPEPVQAAAVAEPEPVAPVKPSPFGDSLPAAPGPNSFEAAKGQPRDPGVLTEPPAGTVFYQVGSIERGMSTVLADYLTGQGFRTRLAPGISPALVRVLVGPLSSEQEIQKTNTALDAAGFDRFLRKY